MAKTINVKNLILRHDTLENWQSSNPVLQKGEMVLVYDAKATKDPVKIKIGDGSSNFNALPYQNDVVAEAKAPTTEDKGYKLGKMWVDTSKHQIYMLFDEQEEAGATWKQIATMDDIEGLGAGDMLKSVFAKQKPGEGYVDKAVLADTATNATNAANATSAESAVKLSEARNINLTGDATGSTSFDGSANADIAVTISNETIAAKAPAFVVAGERANIATGETIAVILGKIAKFFTDLKGLAFKDKVAMADFNTDVTEKFSSIDTAISGKQNTITGAATSIVTDNLTADRVLVSDASGKVAVSNVDKATLEGMSGRIDTLAGQVDNIPKYNYLTGVTATVADANISNQTEIDKVVKPIIAGEYEEANKWDAVVAAITFTPSDVKKDAVYYYNGTDWVFLYYVSTGINRANGETAGIVENSDDITFADGKGTVVQAGKVKNALTAGGKTFDGSTPVTIEASDLGALTAVPEEYVTNTDFATAGKGGVVKSSVDNNKVTVEADGTMTVNIIEASKISGAVAEASKLTNALTIQKNGTLVDTFDGSQAKTVNIEVPTASTQLSDTAHILYDTDEIVINCGGAAQE